jgi:hypothetical protein
MPKKKGYGREEAKKKMGVIKKKKGYGREEAKKKMGSAGRGKKAAAVRKKIMTKAAIKALGNKMDKKVIKKAKKYIKKK